MPVVIVSGGGSDPREQMPRLLDPIINGEAELAQGSRYLEGSEFLQCLCDAESEREATRFCFRSFAPTGLQMHRAVFAQSSFHCSRTNASISGKTGWIDTSSNLSPLQGVETETQRRRSTCDDRVPKDRRYRLYEDAGNHRLVEDI